MKTTRKRYTGEFKAKVALEAIRGDLTLAELAARHGIHPTMIATWKRQATNGLAATFSGASEARLAAGDNEIEKLHAKIGQLVVERDQCHIGIALAPQDGTEADTLLARADLAMYRAKASIQPFRASTMPRWMRPLAIAASLRATSATRSPRDRSNCIIRCRPRSRPARSVAMRCWSAGGTLPAVSIPPVTFIPLAEEIGEIIPLSNWIIAQACFEAALWPNRHIIAVNLSPLHLSDPGLVDTVRRALADSGLPPERLTMELTESAIIRDRYYALEQLRSLKAMGVGLALDDFGVGYSSLDVLRSFAFDRIKLDKSFVEEIEDDEQAVAILRSIVALSTTLHIPVLAEGIEQPGQLRIIAREGCSAIQGYLIGRPSRELADPHLVRTIMARSASGHAEVSLVA